jgi:hypothetical protein
VLWECSRSVPQHDKMVSKQSSYADLWHSTWRSASLCLPLPTEIIFHTNCGTGSAAICISIVRAPLRSNIFAKVNYPLKVHFRMVTEYIPSYTHLFSFKLIKQKTTINVSKFLSL